MLGGSWDLQHAVGSFFYAAQGFLGRHVGTPELASRLARDGGRSVLSSSCSPVLLRLSKVGSLSC